MTQEEIIAMARESLEQPKKDHIVDADKMVRPCKNQGKCAYPFCSCEDSK